MYIGYCPLCDKNIKSLNFIIHCPFCNHHLAMHKLVEGDK